MTFKKIFLPMCLLLSLGLLIGCVDVNDANLPTSKDFRSLIRFVNVATDVSGTNALIADGATLATLSFGQASQYLNVAAGSRTLIFAGTSQVVTFATDQQGTVLIAGLNDVNRFVLLNEGDNFKNNGQADTVLVRFVNVARGSSKSIDFTDGSATGTALSSAVAYFASPAYGAIAPGTHRVYVVSPGGYETTLTNVSSGTGTFDLTAADGLAYSITIVSANRPTTGNTFFLSAEFRNAPAGIAGPNVHSLDVTDQTVSFPAESLGGTGSLASGVGTFALTANSTRDAFALAYTLTVVGDTLDHFTAAHFNSSSGVVRMIHPVSSGEFLDTAMTGAWATGDAEPLTKSLVDSLLAGRLSVIFQSIAHPAGAIQARLAPDSISRNTFSGTWSGASLTDSLKRAIVHGNMYVQFHYPVYPSTVRGQLTVDSTIGQYGVASLSASDTTFVKGKMYTIVATGSGTNLRLLKFTDRQLGSAKLTAHKPSK